MRSANDIHPGAIVAGKYRVRAILGRNHGLTIDAFHTSFDQRAIVKLLLPNQAAVQEVERFRRESRALSKIASEHVARIHDVGTEPDGSVYLVREYVDGTDLERHVRKSGPLPLQDAILYVLQASEAVAEAHANSIVVRDLEPAHLFLTQRTGGAPLIKLTDFGTAKLISGAQEGGGSVEITGTAMFGLTPYASPELIRKARDVDARTDVWSLGAILYELLAGKPPFQGEAAALMLQITREAPQPLSYVRSDVSQELENAIGWALAKDPDARFRNVYAFAHALLPFAPAEGKLLVERIGQITATAKEKKASGSVPPPSLPPPNAPAPRTASSPGWVPPPNPPPMPGPAPLPRDFANLPIDEDAETSIIPGSINPAALKGQYPFAAPGAATGAPSIPLPRPSAPMMAAPSTPMMPAPSAHSYGEPAADHGSTAPLPSLPPASTAAPPPVREPAPTVVARPPDVTASNDQNKLLRVLLAFCAIGLVAAVILAVLLIRKQGSSEVATTNESQAPSSTAIVVAAPTNPPPPPTATVEPAAASSEPPAPSASASASAAPSAAPAEPVAAAEPEATAKSGGGSKAPPPPPPPPPAAANGTLVAVSVGGPCTFSVNGASKGTSSSIRLTLKPGSYAVMCRSKTGVKAKSVTVQAGQTAMAMFKN